MYGPGMEGEVEYKENVELDKRNIYDVKTLREQCQRLAGE